jgi:YhcH/YjgK/YiaL family protein
MILDSISNAHLYRGQSPGIACALDFLRSTEAQRLEPPAPGTENSLRHELRGDDVFALVQRYRLKHWRDAAWEAHRRYIDVQHVVEGVEAMGFAPLSLMREAPYDAAKDLVKLEVRKPGFCIIAVPAGHFAIFMPHDAHAPGIEYRGSALDVKKIVVKVRV